MIRVTSNFLLFLVKSQSSDMSIKVEQVIFKIKSSSLSISLFFSLKQSICNSYKCNEDD